MVPATDKTTINSAMFLICTMSPTAKDGIETESYRQNVDTDEATDQFILESAFMNMIKDLQALGLVLDIDWTEIFESKETLFTFLTFASYLLPNSLYTILKNNQRIKECVCHILDGSLGDEETVIQTYLSELGGLDGQDPLVPEIASFIEQYYASISQTDLFVDYFRNMQQLVHNERFATEIDAETHECYRTRIRNVVARLADASNAFVNHPLYDKMCQIQDQIILDIVAPTNFVSYNYIFTLNETALPEDLVPSFQRQWYHYQVSNSWCPHYHKIRNITPSDAHILAMYCFLYAIHDTKEEYLKEALALYAVFPSPVFKQTVDALYPE